MNIDDHILFNDGGVLVLNKPLGITTSGHSLEDEDCLQWHVMKRFGGMVWAVHQIDKLTTGVNVFVRTKSLVPIWQERLRHPIAKKDYVAICHGEPQATSWRITDPIGVRADELWGVTPDGKHATTVVERLATNGTHSLLRVRIKTGRTNQIRVHLAHHGFPLVGEGRYTPVEDDAERHMLHAWRVRFSTAEAPFEFRAPLAPDFRAHAESLGFGEALAELDAAPRR